MGKGVFSSAVRILREGVKLGCAKISALSLRSKSYPLFGIPAGLISLDHLAKENHTSKPVVLTSPQTVDTLHHWQFRNQEVIEHKRHGYFSIPNGIATTSGGNLTKNGKLVTTYLQPLDGKPFHKDELFRFSTSRFFPKILKVSQPVVSIATGWQGAFYHWFYEVLPRLGVLEKENIPIEKLFVEANASFQKESLNLLGFLKEQIINTKEFAAVQAPEIIIPSIPHSPERSSCNFLREKFIPHLKKRKPLRLYISRRDAFCRRIINEEALFDLLKEDGFQRVEMTKLSLKEQMELFYNAEKIVAPHGAALSLLAFCEPGTSVLEIFSTAYVNTCYWIISHWRGLNYHYLFGEGEVYPDHFNPRLDPDIEVDLEKFKQYLAL